MWTSVLLEWETRMPVTARAEAFFISKSSSSLVSKSTSLVLAIDCVIFLPCNLGFCDSISVFFTSLSGPSCALAASFFLTSSGPSHRAWWWATGVGYCSFRELGLAAQSLPKHLFHQGVFSLLTTLDLSVTFGFGDHTLIWTLIVMLPVSLGYPCLISLPSLVLPLLPAPKMMFLRILPFTFSSHSRLSE